MCEAICVGNCCTNTCEAGCADCTGTCSGDGCRDGCYSCWGGCTGSCESGCMEASIGGGTGCDNCADSCTANCSDSCNDQCDGKVQDENIGYIKNGLHKKFLKSDIKNIKKCIEHEAKRRGENPISINFSNKEKLNSEKINQLITNLEKAGQDLSVSAEGKRKALESLGQTLVDKVMAAYNEVVDYNALGITVPDDIYKSVIPLN